MIGKSSFLFILTIFPKRNLKKKKKRKIAPSLEIKENCVALVSVVTDFSLT